LYNWRHLKIQNPTFIGLEEQQELAKLEYASLYSMIKMWNLLKEWKIWLEFSLRGSIYRLMRL
jgi:hypothetical protein